MKQYKTASELQIKDDELLNSLDKNGWTPYDYKVLHEHATSDWKTLAKGINLWIAQGRPQIVNDHSQTWLVAIKLYELGELK